MTLHLGGTRLQLCEEGESRENPVFDVEISSDSAHWPQEASAVLNALGAQRRRVRVLVSRELAYIRPVTLPAVTLSHLRTVLPLQFPKLLPADASGLLIDWHVAQSDARRAVVDIACVQRHSVEPVLAEFRARGLRVTDIGLAEQHHRSGRFAFHAYAGSALRPAWSRIDRLLVQGVAVLGAAALCIAVTQGLRAEHALREASMHMHTAAASALARRQSLLTKLEPLAALSNLEKTPTAANVLSEVTKAIPRDAWITTFELKDGHLRLVGISPDTSHLVMALSDCGSLTEVELRSSLSAGPNAGKDRFEIVAQLKDRRS